MFKNKFSRSKKGISTDDFSELLSQVKFINKNLHKLDFICGIMITKKVLNGRVYVSNISPSLSEIDNMDSIIKRIDLVNMVNLYTDKDELEIYQDNYKSHTVTDSYIEINFLDGKFKRLNY